MKKSERAEFGVVIGSTAELYGKTLTDAALELWWSALSDMPLEDVKQGISRHLRDADRGKWMPMPADVRYACGLRHPTGLVAWGEVLDAMERHGAYRSVLFEDGVVNAVIRDMGGWPEVCHKQSTDQDPIWVQKDFEKRYEEYRQAGRIGRQSLLGLCDETNLKGGYLDHLQAMPIYIESTQAVPKALAAPRLKSLLEQPATLRLAKGGEV